MYKFFAQKHKNVQNYLAVSNNNRNFADVLSLCGGIDLKLK